MNLLLEIISHQRHTLTEEQSRFVFKTAGGTIGRNQKNDWLIDDPERLISGQHASIHFENNQFVIFDTSTNGLFVNQDKQALGDQYHVIINGDIFLLGQYSLQATLIATQSRAVYSSSIPHNLITSSLHEGEYISEKQSAQPVHSRVLKEPSIHFSSENITDKLSHELPQNLSPVIDPLSLFNDVSGPGRLAEQDMFSESDPISSVLDPIPSTQSYFDLPNAIPENWLNNQATHSKLKNKINPSSLTQKPIIKDYHQNKLHEPSLTAVCNSNDNIDLQSNSLTKEHNDSVNTSSVNKHHEAVVGDFEDFKKEFNASEPSDDISLNINQTASVDQSITAEESPAHDFHGTIQSNDAYQEAINVLLVTLGINLNDINHDQLPELTKKIALITKNSMSGIMKTMVSRAHLKNEFRMSMTTIQAKENNPLKFCINYEQLVHYLLLKPMSGYLNAEQAVEEAFDELQEHQVGVMAGMKSALKYMLEKLSPEKVVEKSDSLTSKILGISSKKSRYWDTYGDIYNDIKDEDDVFTTFFGNEFCKAYERQIEDIRQARK